MRLKTVMYPNEKLSKPEFEEISDWSEVKKSADKLKKTMRANKRESLAMAANQANVKHKMFVMKRDGSPHLVFVEPVIIESDPNESYFEEYCLSFSPKVGYKIKRPNSVVVIYKNIDGETLEQEFKGLEARVIQHEIDHLNGITMYDRWVEQGSRK